ncbi:MAG TPA: S8 family serine peptidase [Bacteroidales bacterium]|nr:S8 family serine peptidase [Bacteroidales bacterium]HPS63268.1 S8 family serine peptidase [Bacteroidales bacterium]
MMKVTVTKYLNVRVGQPSLNAPCYQYLAPGSELEVDGKRYPGDPYDGIDEWMKDLAGNYYWLGGLSVSEQAAQAAGHSLYNSYVGVMKEKVDWNAHLPQIPAAWRETRGAGVKVAVLDSGVFAAHEDLKEAIDVYEDFTPNPDKIDYHGHGTHVAGLIGARSATLNGLVGVAPAAGLICLKVMRDDHDGPLPGGHQTVIDALNRAEALGASIINLSFSLRSIPNGDQLLITRLGELSKNGILIIAAGGDDNELRAGHLLFPANCPGVTAVAAVSKGFSDANPEIPAAPHIVSPYTEYLSSWKDPDYYKRSGGCSMTAALLSGVAALALSHRRLSDKTAFGKAEFLRSLREFSIPLQEIDFSNPRRFYFHLNSKEI